MQDPASVFSRHYDGATFTLANLLPEDVPDELISAWYYDEGEMDWKWYRVGWAQSTLETLENGKIYLIIVMEECTWEIPYP